MSLRRTSYSTLGQAALALGALLWGILFARYMLATLFHAYDDEGYFLLALARYLRPGPLDPATYSHYGPFYYYAQQACFRLLGLPVTHDAGRFVTLLYWVASAMLAGVFVYRISRSLLLGAAATLACISVASVLAHEPGHPQQVVLVLLTLASCLSLSVGAPQKGAALFLLGRWERLWSSPKSMSAHSIWPRSPTRWFACCPPAASAPLALPSSWHMPSWPLPC